MGRSLRQLVFVHQPSGNYFIVFCSHLFCARVEINCQDFVNSRAFFFFSDVQKNRQNAEWFLNCFQNSMVSTMSGSCSDVGSALSAWLYQRQLWTPSSSSSFWPKLWHLLWTLGSKSRFGSYTSCFKTSVVFQKKCKNPPWKWKDSAYFSGQTEEN